MKTERRISVIFGAVLVCFLIVAFFVVPKESQSHPIVRLLAAVFTGAVAFFISGDIYIEVKGQLASKTKYKIQATAGAAFFVLVFLFWNKLISSSEGEIPLHQTATSSGNNSTINQAGHDLTIHNGVSEDRFEEWKQGMKLIEKKNSDQLLKNFPLGYFIFTATTKREVIPNNTKLTNLNVEWSDKPNFELTPTTIRVALPDIIYNIPPVYQHMGLSANTWEIQRNERRVIYYGVGPIEVGIQILEQDEDAVMIVVGFEQNLPPGYK